MGQDMGLNGKDWIKEYFTNLIDLGFLEKGNQSNRENIYKEAYKYETTKT